MVLAPAAEILSFRPRVLVVDDEPDVIELICDLVRGRIDCQLLFAHSVAEAADVLAHQGVEMMLADLQLPDGNGMDLVRKLHEMQPAAGAMIMTGHPSMDGAIEAMRQGAVDFLPKPFTPDQFIQRVQTALSRQAQRQRLEKRLGKMRLAVRRLNEARKMVGKKVDLLCNDLIGAYSDLSKQMDTVRVQEGFRHFIGGTEDLEQLLCHTMDWILRQVGYSNVGIWMAEASQDFQLGAYMKYTIPGDPPLVQALEQNLVGMVMRRGSLRLKGDELKQNLTPAELKFLDGHEVLGVNCTYLGETLAVILLFRDARSPFSDDDMTALQTMSPLFSVSLAKCVRGDVAGEDLGEDGPGGAPEADEDEGKKRKRRRGSRDDWWKRGEPPPF